MMGSGNYLGGSTVVNTNWKWSPNSGLLRFQDFSDKQVKKLKCDLIEKIISGYSFDLSTAHKLLFKKQILKHGSKLNWAKSQPEYNKILKYMLRKSKKNNTKYRVRDECRIN